MVTGSQAEFARHRGVSKKTVTVWKQRGLLHFSAPSVVDFEATERALADAGLVKVTSTKETRKRAAAEKEPDPNPPEMPAAGDGEEKDAPFTQAEAERRKENYLAGLRKLDLEKAAGELIPLATAQDTFLAAAMEIRDAWIGWPARVSTLMAADLSIEARVLTEVLTRYVHQHLAELGEPEADFAAGRGGGS